RTRPGHQDLVAGGGREGLRRRTVAADLDLVAGLRITLRRGRHLPGEGRAGAADAEHGAGVMVEAESGGCGNIRHDTPERAVKRFNGGRATNDLYISAWWRRRFA